MTIPIFPATGQVEAVVKEATRLGELLAGKEKEVLLHRKAVELDRITNEKLEQVTKQTTQLNIRLEQLAEEMQMTISRLETITNLAVPRDVQLESLAPERGGFGLDGNANSHDAILQYAANLRDSALFSSATIQQVKGSVDESVEGSLTFRILTEIAAAPQNVLP